MTPEEFKSLLEYISQNNSWGEKMYEIIHERNRKAIKYVDCSFDSRDGAVWSVTSRYVTSLTGEHDKSFRVETAEDIKRLYRWLDEPLKV